VVEKVKTQKNKKNETDVEIHFRKIWNGFRHPFHKKQKKNNETDVKICFKKMWNGSRHPFHKKI